MCVVPPPPPTKAPLLRSACTRRWRECGPSPAPLGWWAGTGPSCVQVVKESTVEHTTTASTPFTATISANQLDTWSAVVIALTGGLGVNKTHTHTHSHACLKTGPGDSMQDTIVHITQHTNTRTQNAHTGTYLGGANCVSASCSFTLRSSLLNLYRNPDSDVTCCVGGSVGMRDEEVTRGSRRGRKGSMCLYIAWTCQH